MVLAIDEPEGTVIQVYSVLKVELDSTAVTLVS